jgi:hypothetical protein
MGGRAAIERFLGCALPTQRRRSIPGGGSSTRTVPLRAPAVMAGPEHTTVIGGSRSTRTCVDPSTAGGGGHGMNTTR